MSTRKITKKVEVEQPTIPEPDPLVLLYLEAVSRAFPIVESRLENDAQHMRVETKQTAKKIELEAREVHKVVTSFFKVREENEKTVSDLKDRKADITKVTRDVSTFENELRAREEEGNKMVAELMHQISLLQADADQAMAWSQVRDERLERKNSLANQISSLESTHKSEIKSIHTEFDEETRRLRDSLVRKLRRARDLMSTTADDESTSGDIGRVGSGPSAKHNEKLTREVTMYGRESTNVIESIAQLEEQYGVILKSLENERSQNQKLVLRNASHTKTHRMLLQKMDQIKEQYASLSEKHSSHHVARKVALDSTYETQQGIIRDLQEEMKRALDEHEEKKMELHGIQKQMLIQERNRNATATFFQSLLSESRVPNRCETIPALGLLTPKQIAAFLSAVTSIKI